MTYDKNEKNVRRFLISFVRVPLISICHYPYFREEHTQRKIDKLVADAKAKMAKGDKKG